MKFSGKICFKIILKVTKKQGLTLSLEDTFFENQRSWVGGWVGGQVDPPSRFRFNTYDFRLCLGQLHYSHF